jgi:hypothetical protein
MKKKAGALKSFIQYELPVKAREPGQGGGTVTTKAVGEEGGGGITSMAVGEEGGELH